MIGGGGASGEGPRTHIVVVVVIVIVVVEIEQDLHLVHEIRVLQNQFSGPHLDNPIRGGYANHGLKAEHVSLPGPLARRPGEAVRTGDPNRGGVEEGLTGQAGAVDEGLGHGDEEEPLGVGDFFIDGVVFGGGTGDEGVELAKDLLAMVLFGRRRGFGVVGFGFVVFAFVVTVAPSEERGGGGVIVGGLPEDGVGPDSGGGCVVSGVAFDEGLEALLEGVLVEKRWLLELLLLWRRRWPERGEVGGGCGGGGHEGLHDGGVIVGPEIHFGSI